MDIDKIIERMDKEDRNTVKMLSAQYKNTHDLNCIKAIFLILQKYDDDPPKEKELIKKLTR